MFSASSLQLSLSCVKQEQQGLRRLEGGEGLRRLEGGEGNSYLGATSARTPLLEDSDRESCV